MEHSQRIQRCLFGRRSGNTTYDLKELREEIVCLHKWYQLSQCARKCIETFVLNKSTTTRWMTGLLLVWMIKKNLMKNAKEIKKVSLKPCWNRAMSRKLVLSTKSIWKSSQKSHFLPVRIFGNKVKHSRHVCPPNFWDFIFMLHLAIWRYFRNCPAIRI